MKWECEARNDRVAKYHSFTDSSGRVITYAEFVSFLRWKNKDFLKLFIRSLNNATEKLGAYFWECPPLSNETVIKPFEFVVTKSEELSKIKQNISGFEKYLAEINDINKPNVISFPNLAKDAILVIPALKFKEVEGGAEMLDYKNLSQFTKNAPFEQQQEFWKEVGDKLTESLLNSGPPKWLSTHGLGIHYLHVRIDSKPKYYSCEEYKKENSENSGEWQKNNSAPQNDLGERSRYSNSESNNAKEKILANLDKICLDPMANLANAEIMRQEKVENFFKKGVDEDSQEFKEWREKVWKVNIEGEEIYLEKLQLEDFFDIKENLIQQIKQNPHEWIIEEANWITKKLNLLLKNKKTGTKNWQIGFLYLRKNKNQEEVKKDWAEIEARIKSVNFPNINQSPSQSKQENNAKDRIELFVIIFAIFMISSLVLIIYWLGRKKSKNK